MIRAIKYALWMIWIVFAVGLATTIGATQGWKHHGWIGAVALGFAGFCVGGLAACSPGPSIELLASIVSALI